MLKLVSFDIWGTLLDIRVMLENISLELAGLTGMDEERIVSRFKRARQKAKELRFKGLLPPKEAVEVCQQMLARELEIDIDVVRRACARATLAADSSMLLEGAVEALRMAKERCKVVCLGNVQFWPSAQTRVILEKLGVSQHLDRHFFSDELGIFKPDERVFLKICEIMGVRPSESLHVGDRKREDFEGAQKAGFKALLVKPDVPLNIQLKEMIEAQ